jgi:hypothetical protein
MTSGRGQQGAEGAQGGWHLVADLPAAELAEQRAPPEGPRRDEPADLDPAALTRRRMTWNLLHLARMLKDVGGILAHGNQRSGWDAGCRYDFDNPEYR